jgi:hypothetical protein
MVCGTCLHALGADIHHLHNVVTISLYNVVTILFTTS